MWRFVTSPRTRRSKSEEIPELEVWATTRALGSSGKWRVIDELLVLAWRSLRRLVGTVRSIGPLELSARTARSTRSSVAVMEELEVVAVKAPRTRSARMWPLELWAETSPFARSLCA